MGEFWTFVAVIVLIGAIADGVPKIIRAAKEPGRKGKGQYKEMSGSLGALEEEMQDLRDRVEVLEKIVTDQKYQLDREIQDLAG